MVTQHRYNAAMPNARDPDKRSLQLYISSKLMAKFIKLSKQLDIPKTFIITAYLEQITEKIHLTDKEYDDFLNNRKTRKGNN